MGIDRGNCLVESDVEKMFMYDPVLSLLQPRPTLQARAMGDEEAVNRGAIGALLDYKR